MLKKYCIFVAACFFICISMIKNSNAETDEEYVMRNSLYINSDDGKKCYQALEKIARWRIEIDNSVGIIGVNMDERAKEIGCEHKGYTVYGGRSILFYNGFGGSRKEDYLCVKNISTGKFSAILMDEFEEILKYKRGNCQAAYEMIDASNR